MIRNFDQLELSIKALSLHKGDVLVVRVENNPTIREMQNIQEGIANLFSNLELAEPIAYVVIPRTLELSQLDEDGMRASGWVRAWQPLPTDGKYLLEDGKKIPALFDSPEAAEYMENHPLTRKRGFR